MTVSDNIPARAFGYRPKARLTERQEAVMKTLICCLVDLINYTSALRGMTLEKRRVMSNSYNFMPGWFKELGRLAEHITDILDKIRFPNIVPNETRNGEDKKVKSRQQRRNSPHAESTSSGLSRENRGTRKISDACFT